MPTENNISRRSLLKGGAVVAALGASFVSFNQLFGYKQVFGQDGDDPQTILNLAATAETLACTHYYNVLTDSSIALTPAEINILKSAIDAELQHLLFLNSKGGMTLATEFYFPQFVYTDRAQFSEITEQAETAFVAAYLAATRRIAQLGDPLLAATAAQIAVVEQAHLALVRQIGGRVPNHVSLGQALIYNVSEAGPILKPFLEGGEGRLGPSKFPTAEAIQDLIGDVGVLPITPFTEQGAASNANATGDCNVSPRGNFNVNIRSGAGITFDIVGKLKPGDTLLAVGQASDKDGFTWYQIKDTGFVRSDVVSGTGNCAGLPPVS